MDDAETTQRELFEKCRVDLARGIPSLPGGPKLPPDLQSEAWKYAVIQLDSGSVRLAGALMIRGYAPPIEALSSLGCALEQVAVIDEWHAAAKVTARGGRPKRPEGAIEWANSAFILFNSEAKSQGFTDPRSVAIERTAEFMADERRGLFRWVISPRALARHIRK